MLLFLLVASRMKLFANRFDSLKQEINYFLSFIQLQSK